MPSSNFGFLPARRGILEHIEDGRLPALPLAVYHYLMLKADPDTGLVWSCARSICNAMQGLTIRQTQRILAHLETGYVRHGSSTCYIKRFRHPNSSGNYAILINKFVTRTRLRTDADSSTSEFSVCYVSPKMSPYHEIAKLLNLSLRETLALSPQLALLIGSRELELESEVKESGRHTPPPVPPPPVESVEKPKSKADAENRNRYVQVNLLANVAVAVLAEKSTDVGEAKERIKNLAAANGWQYTPQMIENAITIAQERAKVSRGASPAAKPNGARASSSVTPLHSPASANPPPESEMTPEEKKTFAAQLRATANALGPRHPGRHPK